MKHTLEELWNGQIAPGQTCGVGDPQMERLCILLERNREALEQVLTEEQKALLAKYADNMGEFLHLQSVQAFSDGFSLASRLMVEALAEDEG